MQFTIKNYSEASVNESCKSLVSKHNLYLVPNLKAKLKDSQIIKHSPNNVQVYFQ